MGWVDDIIAQVQPFTLTSPERISALCQSVEYIVKNKIPGDFVECGVWKGGSMMAAALALLRLNEKRYLHLFDTFDGMTKPTEVDTRSRDGKPSSEIMQDSEHSIWCRASLEEVETNLRSTGYSVGHLKFVKGPVEKTLPKNTPSLISLLRLDTDWYESTKHELENLYPYLTQGGVLIIDDYGHWDGARKAVDEYIEGKGVLLNAIDYTGRIAVKAF